MNGGERAAHKAADLIRAVAGTEKYQSTAAVILAAGSSERMKGVNKQFAEVRGLPVLVRSALAYEDAPCISEIVIVTRKDDIAAVREMCVKYGVKKLKDVVAGGENRRDSAMNGLLAITDNMKFIAIHDGARCLVAPDMITRVCVEAYHTGAASAGCRTHDTVKLAGSGNDIVSETIDRNRVWMSQTPQVFSADLYRAAAYTAQKENFTATDDCSLVEHIEYRNIRMVDCGRENFKITERDDIGLAEALLALRESRKEVRK